MKKMPGYIFIFLLVGTSFKSMAQDSLARYQVAVFSPLFLDSAFDETTTYKYGKAFPKYINPGLEFYEGAEMAIDSLNSEGLKLDFYIYDSRSVSGGIDAIVKKPEFDSIDLVIGHVNAKEAKMMANAAAKKNIPFINVNYPNDAAVTNNPSYIILNSTLYTHCAAMYKFIQKNFALAPVVVFRKTGEQENRLKSYFDDISKNTASIPLKIKYVTLDNLFTPENLKAHLEEDQKTICIAGSLDVNFGKLLTSQLASLYEQHPTVVFGMPTWWDLTNFSSTEFKNLEVFYTSPFYISDSNKLFTSILADYKSRFYSRPTDMFFRGYETVYHFAHLLSLNGRNIGSSLSDKRYKIFTDYDIQPVLNPKTNTLDYFENKKIYFIKKVNGAEIAVY
ncbi:MAG TPA: hypothetical protein VM101_05595 [Flavitalea sp.]|nr:hypothetical protein [Flavitalea sp.]